jgi:hypothetical protein
VRQQHQAGERGPDDEQRLGAEPQLCSFSAPRRAERSLGTM